MVISETQSFNLDLHQALLTTVLLYIKISSLFRIIICYHCDFAIFIGVDDSSKKS